MAAPLVSPPAFPRPDYDPLPAGCSCRPHRVPHPNTPARFNVRCRCQCCLCAQLPSCRCRCRSCILGPPTLNDLRELLKGYFCSLDMDIDDYNLDDDTAHNLYCDLVGFCDACVRGGAESAVGRAAADRLAGVEAWIQTYVV